ncbi:MAG TPA: dTMP kinase [Candidatus Nanopelagicales bacterium]|nr:dTMP kinase [Candidatus Nanopelagicales bacterium]
MGGTFIAFEGGEGAGKSTQEAMLAQWLTDRGHDVVRTREPGGTPAGEVIRTVLLGNEYEGLDERAEALLFAAARGEHVARVIRPALEAGNVVVCDRFIDSSIAYQGVGRSLGIDVVRELNTWATHGLLPDLTVVLDVDPVIGLSRVGSPDRLESEPIEYHQAVRQAFLDIANVEPDRYLVVDSAQEPEAISALIREQVTARLADE